MASVFSKIIAGELPGHFVWRDEQVVAIMTIQPFKPGHVLVIPKQEIDHWDDMADDLAAHVMLVSKKVAKGIKRAFPCLRVGVMIAGLEVPHVHLHLVPIESLGELSFSQAHSVAQEELADAAAKLRKALKALGNSEADIG